MAAIAGAALALSGSSARAEPPPFVAWEAPEGCPDRQTFEKLLAGHLADAPPPAPMHVEVRIERRGRSYRLLLITTTREAHGERTLTGRDCAVLAEAAALTLALAASPDGAGGPTAGGPTDRAASAVSPSADDESPPGQEPVGGALARTGTRRERGVDVAARGLVTADFGSFPDPAPGLGLAINTRLGRFRIEGHAGYFFEQRLRLENDPADGADISNLVAGLRGCYQQRWRRASAGLCAGGELARTRAHGFGGLDSRTGNYVWPSVSGGPTLALRINNFLQLRTDVEVVGRPFTRPRFVFDNLGGGTTFLASPAWVAMRASAGLEVSFR